MNTTEKNKWGIATQLLHSRKDQGEILSHTPPLYQTSTYGFQNIETMHGVFTGKVQKDAYTRISGQNFRDLEEIISILERGKYSQVFGSGMAVIETCFAAILEPGDRILVSKPVYSGTYALLKHYSQLGVEVKFFDHEILMKDLLALLTPNTKSVLIESPANPTLVQYSVSVIKSALKRVNDNILLMADNTFATPINRRPLTNGANIVIESLTKYINGHGDRMGGSATSNSEELIKRIRERAVDLGGIMAPETAWHILDHALDLPDRMKRHNANGSKVAEFLKFHPKIAKVNYPGFSGMVSFQLVNKSFEATEAFLNELAATKIVTLSVSLGCRDSLICIPWFTTHSSLTPEEKIEQGIPENLIRFSVGLENYEDIENALAKALETI